MNKSADPTPKSPGRQARAWIPYIAIALSAWLGWEVLKVPVALRAPPEIGLRLAPSSPEILGKAAESELSGGRPENATALADASLLAAPFNVRALRVKGLAAANSGQTAQADQLLTLAGNWSLRDDPSHAWLIEQRLKQGNFGSAFAHADTLVRRRPDLYARTFTLFTTAAKLDPRSIPPLARLLSSRPPWRTAYLNSLYDGEGAPVLFSLAIVLQRTDGPLTDAELQDIYQTWLRQNRAPAIRQLRAQLGRPSLRTAVQNGDFSSPLERALLPFGWSLGVGPGIALLVSEDEVREGNFALRVSYNGLSSTPMASQLLTLPPGRHEFAVEEMPESGAAGADFRWRIACLESGAEVAVHVTPLADSSPRKWRRTSTAFTVPAANCSVQTLLLEARPADMRSMMLTWFDNVTVR